MTVPNAIVDNPKEAELVALDDSHILMPYIVPTLRKFKILMMKKILSIVKSRKSIIVIL